MITDKEILDWLDSQSGDNTGGIVWRKSLTGRGWRLHESRASAIALGAKTRITVREAISDAMKREG